MPDPKKFEKQFFAALKPFPDFREELFDKLYTFFQRYFSESGSLYFRYTALHQNVYEKVYTDDRDVIPFWKTHMLYYVKTDRIFTSLKVELDGVKFFFDAGSMTLKKSNEKRQVVYAFRKVDPEGALDFDVAYSERGRSTKVDDILKGVKQSGVKLSSEGACPPTFFAPDHADFKPRVAPSVTRLLQRVLGAG
jgi:adenine-specific DNA-methyltransferase